MLSKTEKREEEKRILKLMEGLGLETIYQPQNIRCVRVFLFLHWKKKIISTKGAFWEQVTSPCLKWKKGY